MDLPATFEGLIEKANQLDLYKNLIIQLNKDFLFANLDLDLTEDILPSSLKLLLHEKIYEVIQNNFSSYLNLLYIIDVSENEVKQLNENDTLKLAKKVSFLILIREWQKVWFRNKYSNPS